MLDVTTQTHIWPGGFTTPRLLLSLIISTIIKGEHELHSRKLNRLQQMRVTTGIKSDEWKLEQLAAEWEVPSAKDTRCYKSK